MMVTEMEVVMVNAVVLDQSEGGPERLSGGLAVRILVVVLLLVRPSRVVAVIRAPFK